MAIRSLEDLRNTAPAQLRDASDAQLITEYAGIAGLDPQAVAEQLGYSTGASRDEVMAGLVRSVDVMQGLGYSALAGLADITEDVLPERAEKYAAQAKDYLNRKAQAQQYEAFLAGKPGLDRVEDIDSFGEGVDYAQYMAGQGVGMAVPIVAGARFLGPAMLGAVPLAARGAALLPRFLGGGGLTAGANFATRRAALKAGGGLAAGTAIGTGMGFGSLYESSVEGGDPSPYKALALSPLYGAADAIIGSAIANAFTRGVGTGLTGSLPKRLLNAGLLGAATEAPVESVQTELEILMNPNLTEEQKASMRLNAPIAGAVGGAAISAPRGLVRPIYTPPTQVDQEVDLTGASSADVVTTVTEPTVTEPTVTEPNYDLPTYQRRKQVEETIAAQQTELVEDIDGDIDFDVPTYLRARGKIDTADYYDQRQKTNKDDVDTADLDQNMVEEVEAVDEIKQEIDAYNAKLDDAVKRKNAIPAKLRKILSSRETDLIGQVQDLKVLEQEAKDVIADPEASSQAKAEAATELRSVLESLAVAESNLADAKQKLGITEAARKSAEIKKMFRMAVNAVNKGKGLDDLKPEFADVLKTGAPKLYESLSNEQLAAKANDIAVQEEQARAAQVEAEKQAEVTTPQEVDLAQVTEPAAEQVTQAVDDVEARQQEETLSNIDELLDGEFTEQELAKLIEENQKLFSDVDPTKGKATGTVRLPDGVILGVARMFGSYNSNGEPSSPRVYDPRKGGQQDPGMSRAYAPKMRSIYEAAMDVAASYQRLQNLYNNYYRGASEARGKPEEGKAGRYVGYKYASEQDKKAGTPSGAFVSEAAVSGADKQVQKMQDASEQLQSSMSKLVAAAGSEKNVEAIVSAIKQRRENPKSNDTVSDRRRYVAVSERLRKTGSKGNTKTLANRGEVYETIDVALSAAFNRHKNGTLGSMDFVNQDPNRHSKADKAAGKKSKVRAVVEHSDRGLIALVRYVSGMSKMDDLPPGMSGLRGAVSPYEKLLGSSIAEALTKTIAEMRKATGKGVFVRFLEDEYATPEEAKAAKPYFDPQSQTVYIHEEASNVEVLHESLHVALQAYVHNKPDDEFVVSLGKALDEVIAFVDDGSLDAIPNSVMPKVNKDAAREVVNVLRDLASTNRNDAILELISYGTTMRDFRMLTDQIKVDATVAANWRNKLDVLFQAIANLVKRVLGVKSDTASYNIIQNTISLLDQRTGSKLTKEAYGVGNTLYSEVDPANDMAPRDSTGRPIDTNYLRFRVNRRMRLSTVTRYGFDVMFGSQTKDGKSWQATADKIAAKADDMYEVIAEKFPRVGGAMSLINASANVATHVSDLIFDFKTDKNSPMYRADQIIDLVTKGRTEEFSAIMDYLDGDTKALDKFDNRVRLKDTADSTKAFFDAMLEYMPQEVRDEMSGKKFSDNLIYVDQVSDVTSHSMAANAFHNSLRNQGFSIEEQVIQDDAFGDLIEKDDLGANDFSGEFYVVTVSDNGTEYKTVVSKSIADINDGKIDHLLENHLQATIDRKRPVKLTRFSNGKYNFKGINSFKEERNTKDLERTANAFRNTIGGLATSFATQRLFNGLKQYSDSDPSNRIIFDDEEQVKAMRGDKPYLVITAAEAKPSKLSLDTRSRLAFVKLSDDANKWGELAGKIVPGTVFNALKDATNRSPILDSAAMAKIMRVFKKNKTAYNPGTHITNIATNVTFLIAHDIPLHNVGQAAELLYAYEFNPDTLNPSELALVSNFMNSGSVLGTFSASELREGYYDIVKERFKNVRERDTSVQNRIMELLKVESDTAQKIFTLGKNIDQRVVGTYAAGDNMFRFAAFLKAVADQQEATGSTDVTPDILRAAGNFARKTFLDYDIDSRAVQVLRQTALPFVSWSYAAAPVIGKVMLYQPWKVANLVIAFQTLDMIASSMVDDDDEETRRKIHPSELNKRWFFGVGPRNYIRVPMLGDENNPVYYNLSAYVPFVDVFKANKNPVFGIDKFPQGLTPNGPYMNIMMNWISGYDAYTGEKLYRVTDTEAERAMSVASQIYNTFAPPLLQTNRLEKYASAYGNGKTFTGQDYSMLDLVGAKVMGLKLHVYNGEEQRVKNHYAKSDIIREYQAAIRRRAREEAMSGYPDEEDMREDIKELERRMLEEVKRLDGIED